MGYGWQSQKNFCVFLLPQSPVSNSSTEIELAGKDCSQVLQGKLLRGRCAENYWPVFEIRPPVFFHET